tara:strand:+ start:154 stop:348 length:195 start_codon:yes stop_codon:yes gene_type:complete
VSYGKDIHFCVRSKLLIRNKRKKSENQKSKKTTAAATRASVLNFSHTQPQTNKQTNYNTSKFNF